MNTQTDDLVVRLEERAKIELDEAESVKWWNSQKTPPVVEEMLSWKAAHALTAANSRIATLEEALGAIDRLCSEEIKARFGTSSHKTESEIAGKSVIYSMLEIPRNMARAALKTKPSNA